MQMIKDVMSKELKMISPTMTVQQAAEQMQQMDVGAIPVCDGTRLVGMVTDRDITIRSTARGQDPKAVKVSDVMSGDVEFCYADASVDEAARMMHEKQLRRMPVKDRNDQFVGIIALSDIATSQAPAETKSKSVEGVSQRR